MNLKQWIPNTIKHQIRRNALSKKFPDSTIETIKVGKNVSLGIGTALGANVDIRDGITIGDYSYVNPESIIASGCIGKYCSIGYRCQIGMFEHPINHVSTSPYMYHKDRSLLNINTWDEIANPPIIGNDVWIGSNVMILQGVTIGDGAIIAGGAVVTKDVPAYTIFGGVPAKIIKKRFDDKSIQYLEELKWWDLQEDELQKHKHLFESKEMWRELI